MTSQPHGGDASAKLRILCETRKYLWNNLQISREMLIFAASEHEFLTTPLSAGSKTLSPLLHLIVTFGWLLFFIRFANFEGGSFGFLNYLCYLCMEIRRSCKSFPASSAYLQENLLWLQKRNSPSAAYDFPARCQYKQRPLPMLSPPAAYERNAVRLPLCRSFPPCRNAVFSLSNPCFLPKNDTYFKNNRTLVQRRRKRATRGRWSL